MFSKASSSSVSTLSFFSWSARRAATMFSDVLIEREEEDDEEEDEEEGEKEDDEKEDVDIAEFGVAADR